MATIYVVLGTTGEWADREKWNVCFKESQEEAEEVRKLCQAQADDYYKWRRKKRPQRSFLRRLSRFEDEEYRAEEQGRRDAMFDKWFSCDYTGTKYYVESLSTEPATDPRWHEHRKWWARWEADQREEQLKHCTLEDRGPIAKLGDLLKSKLTMR